MSLCFTFNLQQQLQQQKKQQNHAVIRVSRRDFSSLQSERAQSLLSRLIPDDDCFQLELYISYSYADTRRFILSGHRPDCFHFLEVFTDSPNRESTLLEIDRLLGLIPRNHGALIDTEKVYAPYAPNDVEIFSDFNSLTAKVFQNIISTKISNSSVDKLIDGQESRRSPFRSESWVNSALETCFVHVRESRQFPELGNEKQREQDLNILSSWEYTALDRPEDELLRLAFRVFEELGVLDRLKISKEAFKRFLLAVSVNYFDNPYHNLCHVIDVLQSCFYLLKLSPHLMELLGPEHGFALLIGCLCHDLGHPSFGNSFLKDISHPLSILFNDCSVLENYHSVVLFSILRHPRYDWARDLDAGCRGTVRRCILNCILGTDMCSHFDFIQKFQNEFPILTKDTTHISDDVKLQLATALIKCADISNVLRPFDIAKRWGVALLNEFTLQGDFEKLLALPVGPLNDRETLKVGFGQHQFLTRVAAPLYWAVGEKIPALQKHFDCCIQDNKEKWMKVDEASFPFERMAG